MPHKDPAARKAYRAKRYARTAEASKAETKAWRKANKAKHLAYVKDYFAKHPNLYAEMQRAHNLKKFGITTEDYDRMHADQRGLCAICGEPERIRHTNRLGEKGNVLRLAVDHCHKTLVVRGLLCRTCNQILGRWDDNPERFEAAARYLRRPRETKRKGK